MLQKQAVKPELLELLEELMLVNFHLRIATLNSLLH